MPCSSGDVVSVFLCSAFLCPGCSYEACFICCCVNARYSRIVHICEVILVFVYFRFCLSTPSSLGRLCREVHQGDSLSSFHVRGRGLNHFFMCACVCGYCKECDWCLVLLRKTRVVYLVLCISSQELEPFVLYSVFIYGLRNGVFYIIPGTYEGK